MGAGASSKGKSPGSAAPKIPTPPQIGQIGQNTMNLGNYESQFINEPWSLGNWGMNIATGGTGPQVTQNPNQGGPQTGYFGTPSVPSGEVQNYTNPFGGGPGGGGGGGPGGGGFAPGGSLPGLLGGFSAGENQAWNTAMTPPAGAGGVQTAIDTATGNEAQAKANEAWGGMSVYADNQANRATDRANQIYNRGQWLTPQQAASINQQTQSAQEQVAQQEGSMGLSGSTQAAQLAGETALAGEATKGQLQQGNMQVAQGWNQVAQGWQQTGQGWQQTAQNWDTAGQNWAKVSEAFTGLGMAEQNQAFNQFTSIAQLSASEQAQMFQEGTAGYQLMQTFMGAVLQPYGISLQGFNDILQANTAQIGDQVALQSSAISADQSGQNQVVSGVSQVLSSLISDFCWVARTVYGVRDPRWMQFRIWMLTRSPNWFRKLYLTYGERFAAWISDKPLLKRIIKLWMNWIIRHG